MPNVTRSTSLGSYLRFISCPCTRTNTELPLDCIFPQFCNGVQLHLVLPPGPKDYWSQLAAEHKSAHAHMKWMYDPDPFEARQTKNPKDRNVAAQGTASRQATGAPSSSEFSQAPEVKMATTLRELVEDAIKKVFHRRSHSNVVF